MFRGRKLLISTKYQKEKVIAPLLEEALGVTCLVAENFDTDLLGTFTGEVERVENPAATARRKCEMAMKGQSYDLAVASEGSFGPHPVADFVTANEEILLLLDKKNGLEIVAREFSLDTNFAGAEVCTEEQLLDFAEKAKFPSHALILRPSRNAATGITKGITEKTHLLEAFCRLLQPGKSVYVETDMRALYNPTRMGVIAKVTNLLVAKANSCCPQCQTPGFGLTRVKRGLPCAQCGFPTQSVLLATSTCQKCAYTAEKLHPHNLEVEDPAYCQLCNP